MRVRNFREVRTRLPNTLWGCAGNSELVHVLQVGALLHLHGLVRLLQNHLVDALGNQLLEHKLRQVNVQLS